MARDQRASEFRHPRPKLNHHRGLMGCMGPLTSQMQAPQTRTSTPSSRSRSPQNATAKVLVPVRYSAWLNGDIGRALERTLCAALESLDNVRVTRLPRAFLVESDEAPGPFLEAVHRATLELEAGVEAAYPVLHHEMGPVWTGTLQSVFT